MFIWESITGRPFEIKNTSDIYIYYYSCLLAGKIYNKTFDEFIDECDEDDNHIKWFISELAEHNKKQEVFNNDNNQSTDKKKVVILRPKQD